MRYLSLVFLLCSFFAKAQQADILIKNGKLIDGTGNSWYYADVAIKNGKIVQIGKLQNYTATKTIDATGLIVSPGFIDVHTHLEDDEKRNPLATNFILDGVTTCITGNCGSSNVNMQQYFSFIDSLKIIYKCSSINWAQRCKKSCDGKSNERSQ
ncbi:MAG: hypothetical protein V9E96_16105 [Chitinophagaceae bacterium]